MGPLKLVLVLSSVLAVISYAAGDDHTVLNVGRSIDEVCNFECVTNQFNYTIDMQRNNLKQHGVTCGFAAYFGASLNVFLTNFTRDADRQLKLINTKAASALQNWETIDHDLGKETIKSPSAKILADLMTITTESRVKLDSLFPLKDEWFAYLERTMNLSIGTVTALSSCGTSKKKPELPDDMVVAFRAYIESLIVKVNEPLQALGAKVSPMCNGLALNRDDFINVYRHAKLDDVNTWAQAFSKILRLDQLFYSINVITQRYCDHISYFSEVFARAKK